MPEGYVVQRDDGDEQRPIWVSIGGAFVTKEEAQKDRAKCKRDWPNINFRVMPELPLSA